VGTMTENVGPSRRPDPAGTGPGLSLTRPPHSGRFGGDEPTDARP
jgi:hypothetical protein